MVPWAPGPLLRLAAGDGSGDDLRRPRGVPVDGSDPDVAALVGAYDAVWEAGPPGRDTTGPLAYLRITVGGR